MKKKISDKEFLLTYSVEKQRRVDPERRQDHERVHQQAEGDVGHG